MIRLSAAYGSAKLPFGTRALDSLAPCMLAMPISPFSSMGALVESSDAPALPQSSLNWSTNRLVRREDDLFRSAFASVSALAINSASAASVASSTAIRTFIVSAFRLQV